MNLTQATPTAPVRVPANHTVTKRLGNWTTARRFQVRAHRGHTVLDLRSPQIPAGDIEVEADLDHATLKLLVAADAGHVLPRVLGRPAAGTQGRRVPDRG
jgi:hypothetical protein